MLVSGEILKILKLITKTRGGLEITVYAFPTRSSCTPARGYKKLDVLYIMSLITQLLKKKSFLLSLKNSTLDSTVGTASIAR